MGNRKIQLNKAANRCNFGAFTPIKSMKSSEINLMQPTIINVEIRNLYQPLTKYGKINASKNNTE
jgi:hypothetical protein